MNDSLLLEIANKALCIGIYDIPYIIDAPVGRFVEGIKIYPSYVFLKFWMYACYTPLLPALRGLDTNVCFVMEKGFFPIFRVSCDWCSICNGILETAKQNIIRDPELIAYIDFNRLRYIDIYLDFILADRTDKITADTTRIWCEQTFSRTTPELLLFSSVYLKLESVELKWCPFKRSKELYYRNKDARYLLPTESIIYEVGRILAQPEHETITCNNCPKVINEHFAFTGSNTDSIFQPLLDSMMIEINAM